MDYKTFHPRVDLNHIVKCYWTLEAPKALLPQKQRIVPDGCLEMIFHLGDNYKQYFKDGKYIIQPKSFVFGQIINPLDIEPTGVTSIFAVRFYPEGFIPFAAIPLKDMDDRAVPLTELFSGDGLKIEKLILNSENLSDKIAVIEDFLIEKLSSPDAVDRTVRFTVQEIISLKGHGSVEDLAKKMSVTKRQLERKFSSRVGLSPKQLSRIIRLQAALKLMQSEKFSSLGDIAHESEYYDQAHFIRDFQEFTGSSPKQFYSDNLKLSALFSGTD